ncbi:MAG TPA: hypothetical protein VHN11_21060 [Xanthobacteraceae bacterium]|jgi:hypothetical protein|nr:hypothetical protein [Xanthobacteraceae bacterium]
MTLLRFFIIGCATMALCAAAEPRMLRCASQIEAANLANVYAAALNAEVHFTNGTPSMVPAIPARRVAVLVKRMPFEEIARDDIALRVDGLCHRALVKREEAWITKGDNNPARDLALLTSANFLGIVVMILDYP